MNTTLRFLQQENARQQEENQRLQDELDLLREYLKALSALENAADQISCEQEFLPLLHKILYYALSLLDATDGSVALLDQKTEELVFAIVRGAIEDDLVDFRMPQDEGIMGWVATHGEPTIVNEVDQDWRFSPRVDMLFGFDTQSMLCVPMRIGPHILGVIAVVNKHSGAGFGEIDQSLLSILARSAAFALSGFDEGVTLHNRPA